MRSKIMPISEGYQKALDMAWDALGPYTVEELAVAARCETANDRLVVPLLDGWVLVDRDPRTIVSDLPENNIFLAIMVLHYLAGCARAPSQGEESSWLIFRQLPGGEAFQAAFQKRVVRELALTFSNDPSQLVLAGSKLKGRMEGPGACVRLPFLPRLPVKVIVWPGDDDIPGSANMLFPLRSSQILPTEDHSEIGAVVLSALRRSLR
ncbi:MAG TPA: DUF3786 domain-containing protein [Methanomassiliicoccales archaeon]|nr:DUF3786 domain-containing protein [Methanomassiliicoccales archaeon]